jgi:hypothetical protein
MTSPTDRNESLPLPVSLITGNDCASDAPGDVLVHINARRCSPANVLHT